MVIESERLTLKEISWNDLEDIHCLHCCPEVDEFNTIGIPSKLGDTKRLVKPMIKSQSMTPRKLYTWKITLREHHTFIGLTGFSLSLDRFKLGEIYYKLLPVYWGKGYATETVKILIRTGFDFFKLHKIEAGVATQNIRSIRVLEKVGMTREGLRRKILPIRGEWVDNYHYAIVEDDPINYR